MQGWSQSDNSVAGCFEGDISSQVVRKHPGWWEESGRLPLTTGMWDMLEGLSNIS